MSAPTDEYLLAADGAGLMRSLDDHTYVAGAYTDPVSLDTSVLVEYADLDLYADPAALDRLCEQLVDLFPDCTSVRIRCRNDTMLASPWRPTVSYMRYVGGGTAADGSTATITVERAGHDLDGAIQCWLVRALTQGSNALGKVADADRAREQADHILAAPGRTSFVALHAGAPIGHLTLVPDAFDDVIGETYVDLVDMLVETHESAKEARAGLVSAAIEESSALRMPLIGTVIHAEDGHGEKVVEGLIRSGWEVAYRDWVRPAGTAGKETQ